MWHPVLQVLYETRERRGVRGRSDPSLSLSVTSLDPPSSPMRDVATVNGPISQRPYLKLAEGRRHPRLVDGLTCFWLQLQ